MPTQKLTPAMKKRRATIRRKIAAVQKAADAASLAVEGRIKAKVMDSEGFDNTGHPRFIVIGHGIYYAQVDVREPDTDGRTWLFDVFESGNPLTSVLNGLSYERKAMREKDYLKPDDIKGVCDDITKFRKVLLKNMPEGWK